MTLTCTETAANQYLFMENTIFINRALHFIILAMLIGCSSANQRTNKMFVEFEGSEQLKDYPSGSTISFYQNQLYLMGDDASSLMVLNTDLTVKEEIRFFAGDTERILKTQKADIESSEWIPDEHKSNLWLFGSGSLSPQRDSAFRFDPETKSIERINLSPFYETLRQSGIRDLNIEGAALVKSTLIFGSRGNLTNKQNHFIQTSFSDLSGGKTPRVISLNLPDGMGISGMSYLKDQDLLLLTTSTENTATAYDDGEIGESGLGVIYRFSEKLSDSEIGADEWIVLSALNASFKGQKIESICTLDINTDGSISAIMVSDDDQGTTRLFRLKLRF